MSGAADRKDMLLRAGLALSSELSLPAVLQRIVDLAAQLAGARYGALGVLGPDGGIAEFVTVGLSPEERQAIGPLPAGRGVLGALIADARPVRLARIGDDPRSVGFPASHPPMTTFLGAPVKALGRVFGNLYLADKRGGIEFTQEDEDDLVVLASQAGVAVANATLYEEARHRERWLDALRQTTIAILGDAPIALVLELICRLARELAQGDLAAVVVPGVEPGRLVVSAADGERGGRLLGLEVPLQGSVLGEAMRTGRSVALADAGAYVGGHQPMVRRGRMGPSIFVPLAVRGQPFGVLAVSSRPGAIPFREPTVRLVQTFADQASVALGYSRARRDAARLAVMDERERIARDLHDGVIQALFAVGMSLQGTAAAATEAQTAQRIESAVGEIDRVITDLRNYVFGLRPGIAADRHFDQALRALVEELAEETGVRVELDVDPDVAARLSFHMGELLRVTREALSNVGRHAAARVCRVSLRRDGGTAVLAVEDDGRGYDAGAVPPGAGLAGVRDRLERLGGSVRVETAPGRGTRLTMVIPI